MIHSLDSLLLCPYLRKYVLEVFQKNDSFDDRFCDDLCEDILQYLSLEDKLRLECVSKQFQRTVFRKEYEFNLEEYKRQTLSDRKYYEWDYTFKPGNRSFKSIETVLKKCPNIWKLNLRGFSTMNYDNSKHFLQLIIKYCNNLIEFNGITIDTKYCESQEFCAKFGLKLKELGRFEKVNDANQFRNLQSLELNTRHFHLDDILQLNLRHLKRLEFHVYKENVNDIREVLQKFQNISHLTLNLYTDFQKSVFNAFKDSPILPNLIELKMGANRDRKCAFIKCLKLMPKKFPNLKRIEFEYDIDLKKSSEFQQVMSALKAFPHLKRLDINLNFLPGLDFDEIFSFKYFPQQLTHLSIFFNYDTILDVSNLEGLDIYLPKLQYLDIQTRVYATPEEATQVANILSRLSSLQTIKL